MTKPTLRENINKLVLASYEAGSGGNRNFLLRKNLDKYITPIFDAVLADVRESRLTEEDIDERSETKWSICHSDLTLRDAAQAQLTAIEKKLTEVKP